MINKLNNNNSVRVNEISIIRITAIILVVLGHSYTCYGIWKLKNMPRIDLYVNAYLILNLLHLPLFVFISGYLFKLQIIKKPKNTFKTILINKGKRLILPYIVFGVVSFLLFDMLMNYKWNVLFFGIDHLWFLLMLFWCFVLLAVYKTIFHGKYKIGLLLMAIMFNLFSSKITNFLCIDRAATYFIYFYIGYLIMENLSVKNGPLAIDRKLSIIFSFAIFIVSMLLNLSVFRNITLEDSLLIRLLYKINTLLISISWVFTFYLFVNRMFKNKNPSNFLVDLDTNTFGIYIYHHMILYLLIWFIPIVIFNNYIIMPLFLFIFSFLLSYLLSKVTRKIKAGQFLIG